MLRYSITKIFKLSEEVFTSYLFLYSGSALVGEPGGGESELRALSALQNRRRNIRKLFRRLRLIHKWLEYIEIISPRYLDVGNEIAENFKSPLLILLFQGKINNIKPDKLIINVKPISNQFN